MITEKIISKYYKEYTMGIASQNNTYYNVKDGPIYFRFMINIGTFCGAFHIINLTSSIIIIYYPNTGTTHKYKNNISHKILNFYIGNTINDINQYK